MRPETPYNPLNKLNLGTSVVDALVSEPVEQLPPAAPFTGAGIYAIYYTGDYDLYAPITQLNAGGRYELPIYVGKAVPPGARKGGLSLETPPSLAVYNRLREHAESISAAANLAIGHFACRYLIVDDIWIPLGENLLIERYRPLWNTVIDGFGNHDPGAGRYAQRRSPWDVLHPGRAWAAKLQPNPKDQSAIENEIRSYLSGPP